MYLESFTLPIDEQILLDKLLFRNGGPFGYIDNPYPCRMFPDRISEIYFKPITIFYGQNGSGKTTLLNLISEKLELKRIAPFFLAMEDARIFDLDSTPVEIKDWWKLENVKIYYEFFAKNKKLFEGNYDI